MSVKKVEALRNIPFNAENETLLLSSLIQKPSLIRELDVEAGHFHLDMHKKLFSRLAEMQEHGEAIEFGTVWQSVADRGWFRDRGDFENFAFASVTPANAEHYFQRAEGLKKRRDLYLRLSGLIGRTLDGSEASEILDAIDRLKEGISSVHPGKYETVSSHREAIRDRFRRKKSHGYSTGFLHLDALWNLVPGELTIATGIPSHGKSAFFSHLAVNLAEEHGWKVGFFSAENRPLDLFVSRLAPVVVGKPFNEGVHPRMTEEELEHALSFLDDHFFFLDPPAPTVDAILSLAGRLTQEKGIKLLVVDPWNELDHQFGGNRNETQYISEALGKIRRFGRQNGIHIVIVAHPMKLQKDKNGQYPVPTPYDIAGSAHFRNKADNCLTIWRSDDLTQVIVQKVRFDETGKLGTAEFRYDVPTKRFLSIR